MRYSVDLDPIDFPCMDKNSYILYIRLLWLI